MRMVALKKQIDNILLTVLIFLGATKFFLFQGYFIQRERSLVKRRDRSFFWSKK
jgi:hypothetical protein